MRPPLTPMQDWIRSKIGLTDGAALTREALEAYQLGRLRETLDYVRAFSPFYRARLKHYPAEAIRGLKDWPSLPLTGAKDLISKGQQFLCVSQSEIARVVTLQSSGTASQPKRLFFTSEDIELTIDFFQQGMSNLVGPGETVLVLLPGERPGSVGDLLVRGLARMGVKGIIHGLAEPPESVLEAIAVHGVDCLVGLPVHLLALVRSLPKGSRPDGQVKSVLLTADYVPLPVVRTIEGAWGCRVFQHYGMTEMGLGGGVECSARSGYHLREADLFFEIIDPVSGEALPDGNRGEVVFTTLTRRGMPFIRYRTGDLAAFRPEPCPCGTVLKTLERISGRLSGIADLSRERHLSTPELDEKIFQFSGVVDYEAALETEDGAVRLVLSIFLAEEGTPGALAAVRRLVMEIPAVGDSVRDGTLRLDILPGKAKIPRRTGTIKRMIQDKRTEARV